jgi:RNA polymerase sigma factor (sigma-70 family)
MTVQTPAPAELTETRGQLPETERLYYVKVISNFAWYLLRKSITRVARQDLEQIGWLALCEAWRDYDPSRGAQFRTYAYMCVRGAMLDSIRKGVRNQNEREYMPAYHARVDQGFRLGVEVRDLVRSVVLPDIEMTLIAGHSIAGYTLRELSSSYCLCPTWATKLHARGLRSLQGAPPVKAPLRKRPSRAKSRPGLLGRLLQATGLQPVSRDLPGSY